MRGSPGEGGSEASKEKHDKSAVEGQDASEGEEEVAAAAAPASGEGEGDSL